MLFAKKPQQKLEDIKSEYNRLKAQNKRNTEAANLKQKIFAMKHPTLMNIGRSFAEQGKGKGGRIRKAGDVFAEVDKKFGGW